MPIKTEKITPTKPSKTKKKSPIIKPKAAIAIYITEKKIDIAPMIYHFLYLATHA